MVALLLFVPWSPGRDHTTNRLPGEFATKPGGVFSCDRVKAILSMPSRAVLRQDEQGVRPQTDVGVKGHGVHGAGASHGVVAQLVTKVCAIALPVAIKAHAPPTRPRKTQGVTAITPVGTIRHDHHVIAGTAIVPAMIGDHFVCV